MPELAGRSRRPHTAPNALLRAPRAARPPQVRRSWIEVQVEADGREASRRAHDPTRMSAPLVLHAVLRERGKLTPFGWRGHQSAKPSTTPFAERGRGLRWGEPSGGRASEWRAGNVLAGQAPPPILSTACSTKGPGGQDRCYRGRSERSRPSRRHLSTACSTKP